MINNIMESKFKNIIAKVTGVIEEKNDPRKMTFSDLPGPNTEVIFKKDAMNHPYIKSKDAEFQTRVKKYIDDTSTEEKRKNRNYRILVGGIETSRNAVEFAANQSGPIAHMVSLIEQEGPFTRMQFTVPLDVLETENGAWNAMQADIPGGWRYDRFAHRKFADIMDEYNKGQDLDRNQKQTKRNKKNNTEISASV